MSDETRTVTVPLWAIKFIIDHADLCDDGPYGEGWRSEKMALAQEAVEAAMEMKDDNSN